jgi:hypothetical protein
MKSIQKWAALKIAMPVMLVLALLIAFLGAASPASAASATHGPSLSTGGWGDAGSAYLNGGAAAGNTSGTPSALQIFSNYGFELTGQVISQVQVRYDAWCSGDEQIRVDVSWDGGTTWSDKQVTDLTDTETTYWYDVTSATTWDYFMLDDAKFIVRVDAQTVGDDSSVYLDWMPVEVTSYIDDTAPEVTILDPVDGAFYHSSMVPSACYTVVDDSPTTEVQDGYSTEEGVHTFIVTSTDAADNVGSDSVTYSVDDTAPVIIIIGIVDGATYLVGEVPNAEYTIAETTTYECEEGFSLEVGTHTYTVTATDRAGNIGSAFVTYTVIAPIPVVPEFPAGLLFGTGLIGIVGFVLIKRRRVSAR